MFFEHQHILRGWKKEDAEEKLKRRHRGNRITKLTNSGFSAY
jgi:hypothetical protein